MPEAESSALQHDYEIFIRTTPDALWDAITSGEQTRRYFHGTRIESKWRVGAAVIYHSSRAGNIAVDGEVRHVERTRRLSYTWNVRYDPERSGEAPSLVTWKIEPVGDTCRLTLTHQFSEPSKTFREVKSGWNAILSSLKSLLETGEPLARCPARRAGRAGSPTAWNVRYDPESLRGGARRLSPGRSNRSEIPAAHPDAPVQRAVQDLPRGQPNGLECDPVLAEIPAGVPESRCRSPELSGSRQSQAEGGTSQWVPRQQPGGTGPNGQYVGHFVPLGGECIQPFEDGAALWPRQQPFAGTALQGTGYLGARPHPGDDTVLFAEPRSHQRTVRLGDDQWDQCRGIPVSHRRSSRSAANAGERLAGNTSGGSSRIDAAPPVPGRRRPALTNRSRIAPSSLAAGGTSRATGVPRSRTWTSPPRRTSRR